MELSCTYMSGAGNLFTVIDNTQLQFDQQAVQDFIPFLCSSVHGMTTEGLMLINVPKSNDIDFSVDFFNPDGSTSMMCGNGARCAVRYAQHIGLIKDDGNKVKFSMAGGIYTANSTRGQIQVYFPKPKEITANLHIKINNISIHLSYVHTGSDHIVLSHEELFNVSQKLGCTAIELMALLRHHNEFPRGTNVNVYSIDSTNTITMETYERGVEGITGACGTGALATALHCWFYNPSQLEYSIIPPSGSTLKVNLMVTNHEVTGMALTGDAVILADFKTNFTNSKLT